VGRAPAHLSLSARASALSPFSRWRAGPTRQLLPPSFSPSSVSFGAQQPPKTPASFSPGPARRGLDPRSLSGPVAPPTYLNPNPSLASLAPPPPSSLRRAGASASPSIGRSAALRTTTSPVDAPPRPLEASRAVRWSSGPRHRRNRASTPPPVICSAA
jgi:hypothetical protein